MNFFSVLGIICSTIYVILAIYLIKIDYRSKHSRLFAILCVLLASWSFFYSFIYSETDPVVCWKWYKLTIIGWCMIPSIFLHFFLALTQKYVLLKKWWVYVLLYFPPPLFIYKGFTDILLVKDFRYGALGTVEVQVNTPWSQAFLVYFIVYVFISFALLFLWSIRSTVTREKKQAKIFFFSSLIPVFIGIPINMILPIIWDSVIPAIAPILIVIWILGVWYAIVKYRFMIVTPEVAADEIINKIRDLLIVIAVYGRG